MAELSTQVYSVTPYAIETIINWVKAKEIAIPEIQRPFVWDATKVRNLLDSLYQGYPIGYLITWRNPDVKLKDGTLSAGKRILIDGQQRVTALMAALLGIEVLTEDYETRRIRISFHPLEERFEVANPAIQKNAAWIYDIATIFSPEVKLLKLAKAYTEANPDLDEDAIYETLEKLRKIIYNHVGVIELSDTLDIETVTEIFIRVNSAGVPLSQADFAMSKIAVNESYGGNALRKAIDYFCHALVKPDFLDTIKKNDPTFSDTEFYGKMRWLKNANDDIYKPGYTDLLRVAFTSQFQRGKLQDLVALLSGRNFETKQYEEAIAEGAFSRLKNGVLSFINETNFKRFVMILRSAGFVTNRLIGGTNAINFAYVLYLRGRDEGVASSDLERIVRRWYVMSILRGRYVGNPESAFDFDIRQINTYGIVKYAEMTISAELSQDFWTGMLPQLMETSSSQSPYFHAYLAAQVKLGDKGFLSSDITVQDLLLNASDLHHIYPKNYLKQKGFTRGRYNQIANLVVAQSDINIAIKDKAPEIYFNELLNQCAGGPKKYGGITSIDDMLENLRMHSIPEEMMNGNILSYEDFLEERRRLMALKIKKWFEII